MKNIYKNLKSIRESMHLSQNQFAEKLNTNVSNINRWENGTNGMSVEVAYDIANRLNIPLEKLVSENFVIEHDVVLDDKHQLNTIIMDDLKELTDEDKQKIIAIIDVIKGDDKKK